MPLKCAVGRGAGPDSLEAGRQAADACLTQWGQGLPDLLLVFAGSRHDQPAVLQGVRQVFSAAPLIGCSTAGEIYAEGPEENTVAVAALDGLDVQLEQGGHIHQPRSAGVQLGRKFAGRSNRIILLFSDGLGGDGAELVAGVQEGVGTGVPLIGGAAGDDYQFAKTSQFLEDRVLTGTVVGAGLQGDFRFGLGIRHGWEPVGLPVTVTRSENNRLLAINDLPAIRLYQEYLGEYAERLTRETFGRLAVTYPLGQPVEGSSEYLLRAPMTVEEGGAIHFAAGIPSGTRVRLMIGSPERALDAARIAAMEALSQMEGHTPKLAVLFNCIARRRLFGPRAQAEIAAIRDIIGPQVPVIGFYTYGEIAPLEGVPSNPSCFYNETIVVLTLG